MVLHPFKPQCGRPDFAACVLQRGENSPAAASPSPAPPTSDPPARPSMAGMAQFKRPTVGVAGSGSLQIPMPPGCVPETESTLQGEAPASGRSDAPNKSARAFVSGFYCYAGNIRRCCCVWHSEACMPVMWHACKRRAVNQVTMGIGDVLRYVAVCGACSDAADSHPCRYREHNSLTTCVRSTGQTPGWWSMHNRLPALKTRQTSRAENPGCRASPPLPSPPAW